MTTFKRDQHLKNTMAQLKVADADGRGIATIEVGNFAGWRQSWSMKQGMAPRNVGLVLRFEQPAAEVLVDTAAALRRLRLPSGSWVACEVATRAQVPKEAQDELEGCELWRPWRDRNGATLMR